MAGETNARFTWYGHSVFQVDTPGGKRILIDPWLGNPRSPITVDQVAPPDVLLVTHGHDDHMGEALQVASRARPKWPCMHEMSLWLGRRLPGGSDAVIGMNKGGTVKLEGISITMVAADHSAGDWNASAESTLYLGEPVGFVVELEDGFRFYFAGDTALFGDMRLIAELHRPELAFLPIGGHFTMDPAAAALAVGLLRVRRVVPIHYGTFPLLAGTPDALRKALQAGGQPDIEVVAPEPGETFGW